MRPKAEEPYQKETEAVNKKSGQNPRFYDNLQDNNYPVNLS